MQTRSTRWLPLLSLIACVPVAGVAKGAVVQIPGEVRVGPTATGSNNEYQMDVNGDGVDDVNFNYTYGITLGRPFPPSYVSTMGLNGAAVAVTPTDPATTGRLDAHFGPGQTIGADSSFAELASLTSHSNEVSGLNGPWGFSNGPHFLGVRLPAGPDVLYAWVRVSHDPSPGLGGPGAPQLGPLIIYARAYETEPGVAITTAPEPGAMTFAVITLAGLAMRRTRGTRR